MSPSFVLEKAGPPAIVLLIFVAVIPIGLYLRALGKKSHRWRPLWLGTAMPIVAGAAVILALTSHTRVTVSCAQGRIEVHHEGPFWDKAHRYALSEVRRAGTVWVRYHSSSALDLDLELASGQHLAIDEGPWIGYGGSRSAAGALNAAIGSCRNPWHR